MGIRSLGSAVLLVALLVGAGVGFAHLDIDGLFNPTGEKSQRTPAKSDVADLRGAKETARSESSKTTDALSEIARSLGGIPSSQSPRPSFDVARVSPDGVSVFAGRAQPFERINVLVGDLLVGTASADSQGNWTLVTEEKIPDPSAELHLETAAAGSNAQKQQEPASAPAAARPATAAKPGSVADVNKRLFASLEGLVEEARAGKRPEDRQIRATTTAAAAPEVAPSAPEKAASREAPVAQVQARSIPIPVQFVYREAAFTEEGQAAVRLLLEYLKVTEHGRITLSGHADERGSQELNMQLSRERLEAVRDQLRAGGYNGEIILLPKGESEPFAGVDRNALPPEDLYQLDRRVELRLGG
ncbi:MAG: OmpA family protein [Alphaproteobacteria bacterium]|nr:OmpA family protein [Alphaproteobacteria bacterium]